MNGTISSPAGRRVLVIGGGAIGTACAYYLAKAGWRVALVDQDRQGRGATAGNCGLMAYGHVLPLNEPGAVLTALKAMRRKDAPFYIKPRLDPALWAWLLKFAARCNARAMMESARARAALIQSSAELFRELVENESLECELRAEGCLFIYHTPEGMAEREKTNRLLSEEFGVTFTRYDGDALLELEPALKPGAAVGGWVCEQDAQVRPETLLASWRRVLEDMGVVVRDGARVVGFVRRGGRAVAAYVNDDEEPADAFVVAAGAWTPLLGRDLGRRIPIQPGKGYSITMKRPALCPRLPVMFQEDKVVVTPMESAYRLGSTMEFAGYDDTLNRRRLDLLKRGAERYLREPYTDDVEEEWFGWRPMTYDGKPIIDWAPEMENVLIAAGHNMMGLTMAPATGRLVAELLDGRPPHIDPQPFSLRRF